MKKRSRFIFMFIAIVMASISLSNCSKVPAGHVGIKFYLLGTDKGVDYEELTPGRYWIGINEELFLFPTFTQNYVWTASEDEGSLNDESFNFQDKQGLELNADIGITYHLEPEKVDQIFQKYKRGVDEITDLFLRNMVRDALVNRTSKMEVSEIYGEERATLIDSVQKDVMGQCASLGIIIDKLYWVGRIKVPDIVKTAIEAKINATQIAQQRENELRETEAKAKKQIVEAEGIAKSIIIKAEAQAKANKFINASLTENLVRWKSLDVWDGKTPMYWGGNALPFINLK